MYFLYKNSTIKWCEDKNAHSNYIIEWYNTWTGLCLSLSGLLFYYGHINNVFISNFKNTCKILGILGVGTWLFHSTLLYIFQLTDEIPMLLLCFEYIKIIYSFKKLYKIHKINEVDIDLLFMHKFIYYYSGFIAFVGFIFNTVQILLFQSLILLLVIYILSDFNVVEKNNIFLYKKLLREKNHLEQELSCHYKVSPKLTILKNNINYITKENDLFNLYKKCIYTTALSSVVVWLIDNLFCNQIKYYNISFNGHAIWHILTSIGLFFTNKIFLKQYKIIHWYQDLVNGDIKDIKYIEDIKDTNHNSDVVKKYL